MAAERKRGKETKIKTLGAERESKNNANSSVIYYAL